jgi:release factor glutamine methyltransferase
LTLIEAINQAALKLSGAGVSDALRDAETLLCHALGKDRAWLLAHGKDGLDEDRRTIFEQAVGRRVRREPLQYILGAWEFWGLEFLVTPDVLIPRPETELIVETALTALSSKSGPFRIIDLCTGSGCIAVSLAKELPDALLFATDASAQALSVARKNAVRHDVADRIRFFEGDLLGPLEELDLRSHMDLVVSNPPYIASGDRPALQPEVRDFEPELALFAGPDGTELHERIIGRAPVFLKQHGGLIMELGIGQAGTLARMIRETGAYEATEILKDLAGIERVIMTRKKMNPS